VIATRGPRAISHGSLAGPVLVGIVLASLLSAARAQQEHGAAVTEAQRQRHMTSPAETAQQRKAGATQELPAPVAQALHDARIGGSGVAAVVQEIGATHPILAHNADTPMNPASVMKLVTTYTGLRVLGPAYSWETQIYSQQLPHDGVLAGDIYLKGSGDPKLTLENFWLLLHGLRERGVRDIRGDLVLDRSAFEAAEIDPAKFDQEPLRPYNVGPDPLLVNFKAVRFQFLPEGDRVLVVADPDLPQVETVSTVKPASGECGDWRAQLKVDVQSTATTAHVAFSGVMPASCGPHDWYIGLLSHPNYVYGIFKSLWAEMGGTLQGSWRDGVVPEGAVQLTSGESPPLADIVRDINKYSNNVMARQLFLTLARHDSTLPASTARAAAAVHGWLEESGVALPELVLENGSGLSRKERISAGGMVRLLVAAYASPVMPEFIASMPIVAYDGTMKRHTGLASMSGQGHIKTGSLNEVRTIAGYVQDRAGRRYAVAFFLNHPNAENAAAAQDAFLRWVYDSAGSAAGR
jgi:D-alanyl-D-alanine carboxypeptidase/D-alanyl-D-alanine-endopeptidase (penicillin-binding protein 4)